MSSRRSHFAPSTHSVVARNGLGFFVACFVACLVATPTIGWAIEAKSLPDSLELYWQAQLPIAARDGLPIGMSLHSHSSDRNQMVSVMVGNRLVESFDANDLDRKSYQEALVAAKSGDNADKLVSAPPRLGLEGATAKANEVVARLKVLGKKPTLVTVDTPIVYLVVTSSDGLVQTMNAETGQVLWNASAGTSTLPSLPAGVSDDYVAVINGNRLYVYTLQTGQLLNTRPCKTIPSGMPKPAGDWIFVPGMNGRMTGYHATDPEKLTWAQASSGRSETPPSVSLDKRFLSWSTSTGMINFAKIENEPEIWNRLHTDDDVSTAAIPVPDGFVIVSDDGKAVRMSFPNETDLVSRSGGMVWKYDVGSPLLNEAIAGDGVVLIPTIDRRLVALDIETGLALWNTPVRNVESVLAVSDRAVYVRTTDRKLGIIDRVNGQPINTISGRIARGLPNTTNDRIYLISPEGMIVCIREEDKLSPLSHFTSTKDGNSAHDPDGLKEVETSEKSQNDKTDSGSGNVFGSSPSFGSGEDPFSFGTDSSSRDTSTKSDDSSDNPFDF
jgi:outer membrane protein assembly factor BamB